MARKLYKPGEKVTTSGQYEIIGVRGSRTGEEITGVKTKPFPPTKAKGQRFILVDKTK